MTAYSRRQVSGIAADTTLNGGINSAVLALTLLAGTGYPDGSQGNFFLTLDPGLSAEEVVLCSATSGVNVTIVARGQCQTSAVAHASGAVVRHGFTSQDADEANKAVAETVGRIASKGDLLLGTGANALIKQAIGANGTALVADNSQSSGAKWAPPIPAIHDHSTSGLGGPIPESSITNLVSDLSNKADAGTLSAHIAATSAHGVAGNLLGTSDVQVVSNKDLTDPTNTFPTTLATLAGVQQLTNKTILDLVVRPSAAGTKGEVIKAQAAQSANLLEFQSSTATVLGGFDNSGRWIPPIIGQYVTATANVTPITAGTDIVTLASITGDGVQRIKITCGFDSISSTGADFTDTIHCKIMEGATDLRKISLRGAFASGYVAPGSDFSVVLTPAVGAHTYKFLVLRAGGAGTVTLAASATSPAFIQLEVLQ